MSVLVSGWAKLVGRDARVAGLTTITIGIRAEVPRCKSCVYTTIGHAWWDINDVLNRSMVTDV
jgi:hypothetical protein